MIIQCKFYSDNDNKVITCIVLAVQYLNGEKYFLVRPIDSTSLPKPVPANLAKIIDDYIPLDWVSDEKRGVTSFIEYIKDSNFLNYLYEDDYFGIEKYNESIKILEREENKVIENFLAKKHFDIDKYKSYAKRKMEKEYSERGFEMTAINNEIEKINLNRDIEDIISFVISPPANSKS